MDDKLQYKYLTIKIRELRLNCKSPFCSRIFESLNNKSKFIPKLFIYNFSVFRSVIIDIWKWIIFPSAVLTMSDWQNTNGDKNSIKSLQNFDLAKKVQLNAILNSFLWTELKLNYSKLIEVMLS